jgi:WYL domain
MEETGRKTRWGVEQRLEFIEFISYWEGAINRSNITEHFGVSVPQASSDLTAYQKIAPQNLQYDLSSKRYVAKVEFDCKLIKPDADRYLGQLTALTTHAVDSKNIWLSDVPVADVIPVPTRRVDPAILRSVLRAIRARQSIEIQYQSLNPATPNTMWRRMTPHAFASDGFRWHVRAFCHRNNRFKDFLLSRCSGTRQEGSPGALADQDTQWSTYFNVELVPNPRLSPSQKKAVELDYAMHKGRVVLPVRFALLYYFDKHLRVDLVPQLEADPEYDARKTPIVVANVTEYEAALTTVGVQRRPTNQSQLTSAMEPRRP